ncbi:hypothetical protein ACEWY4_025728 [Coilia grayii]|uniref:C2H2-type domain-containing protein n=1 Tax=Coilia grayii TaxID=363190 RepID=A0ABD1ISQ7_9TELE
MELSWPPSLTCKTKEKRKESGNMETDVAMLDDPPEKDESSKDTEKDAESLNDNKELPTKEIPEQLPDGQCIDQSGQDEAYAEEAGTDDSQIAEKASKKSPCKMHQGAVFSGKILSFCCSECKGDTTYSPNDLLKHFQGSHKGTLPTYPCDLCSFVTNEFSSLQRHRIGHRNPQVTCEICNDGVQYSLLLLTRHYILCHSQNGHFNCEKCEFSTRDAGTFVQHIHHHNEGRHKCVECQYVSSSRRELQRHVLGHSATFPFTCHFCGYGAARKDYLTKHMATAHCEEKARWKMEDKPCMTSPPGLKLLLKKGPVAGGSREPQWMSKLHTLPGVGLLDQNGRFYNPEKTLEETQQFLERAVRVKKENSLRMNSAVKTEPQCSHPSSPATTHPKPPETDTSHGSGLLSPNNNNGLTVLMVKNKISIPPNCTTKVMGFKMVDGKKHLVLKVIPTKQEPSSPSEGSTAVKESDSQSDDTANESKYAEFSDDGDKSYNSPCSVMSSPIGSHQPDSVESTTAGTLSDLAKAVKVVDTDNDVDDVLPVEMESVEDAEQCRKGPKTNCTLQQEKCSEDTPFSPTSECESPISFLTKESKTAVHQSNGDSHAKNSSSCDSPSESTAELSHLDKPLDFNENRTPIAHSKVTVSDSPTGGSTLLKAPGDTSATPHYTVQTTTLSSSVTDTLSDSSEDVTMPSHLTENDISPSDSLEESVMDSESAQSCSVHSMNTSVDATTDCVAYSNSTDDEPTPPNSDLMPSDLTVHDGIPSDSSEGGKAAISDSAEVKDTEDSFEDKVNSADLKEVKQMPTDSVHDATSSDLVKSTLSDSHEEKEVLNSLEHNAIMPPEANKDMSKSVNPFENNIPTSESAENRDVPLNSAKCATPDSDENKVMLSESVEDKDTAEDFIKDMEVPLNSVGSTDSSLSSDEVGKLPLVSNETPSADDTKHSDMADVTSPVASPMKTRSSYAAVTSVSNRSESVPVMEKTTVADVTDIRSTDHASEKAMTLPSTVESLTNTILNAVEMRPSSTIEEPDALSDSTKDDIVVSDAVNGSPVFDTEPVALITTRNQPTLLAPALNNTNSFTEKTTSPKLSSTSNVGRSDCETSNPVPIHKDAIDTDTSQNVNKQIPLGSREPLKSGDSETSVSHAKDTQAQFSESICTVHTKCVSENQNFITFKKHHSANGRDTSKHTDESSTAQHQPSTKASEVSLQKESALPAVAETGTVLIDSDGEELNSTLSSPTQEVFSFHNYSKETSGSVPDSVLSSKQSGGQAHEAEEVDEEDCSDFRLSADWSLTLDASPTPPQASCCEEEEADTSKTEVQSSDDPPNTSTVSLERVSDSDIEVDECIAAIDEPSHTVEKQTAVQIASSGSCEVEEDATSFSQKGPGIKNNVAVLGRILEKHSDAIINHQLEKERMGTPTVAYDSVRPTKTTLKILQTSEGKQQMFLQTPDNQYAVPVQLASAPGFKLITKSSSSKINVSYVQPGIERPSKTTGLALTLSSGKPGVGGQTSSGGDKAPSHLSSLQLGTTSSGGHYLVNAASLKSPILLSGTVKSPTGEQTTNRAPTCYLLQRPLPVSPVAGSSRQDPSGLSSQTQQSSRSVLAMPVTQTDKTSPVQTGRHAYLVRYISPAKSGILLNNAEGKAASSNTLSNEGGKSRMFLKIVRSTNGTRFLSGVPGSLGKKPIYLATGALQSPYFLMSSNKSVGYVSAGLKASSLQHGPSQQPALLSQLSDTQLPQVRVGEDGVITHAKSHHILSQSRRQRKRQRKALFNDMLETSSKVRRLSSRSEREEPKEWAPVAKDVERTLRLSPFSAFQHIKCPRQNQPVVVLNHPDADIPEVVSIMKSVNKFKGEVLKVALSQRTVHALSEAGLSDILRPRPNASKSSTPHGSVRARMFGSTVRERFILKLKLKKTSRNKYEVVRKSSSGTSAEQSPTFSCWFCGRIFNNQEDWIGHGQRHLMEATRDWNKLF